MGGKLDDVYLGPYTVAIAGGLPVSVACWLIMATAIVLERACTFLDTPTTLDELPVAMMLSHNYYRSARTIVA